MYIIITSIILGGFLSFWSGAFVSFDFGWLMPDINEYGRDRHSDSRFLFLFMWVIYSFALSVLGIALKSEGN